MNKPKSYYYDWSVEKLREIDKQDQKPTILLHACCAPCICWPLEFLYEHFEISVLYNNSNIWPQEEYDIRKNEIVSYIDTFNKQHNTGIQITVTPYDYQSYREKLLPLKDEPECGVRCHLCYKTRMEEA
ncbi:MAG: epoxyqueuosine reductase QueH, partial [Erysipelotrichaceae bacterium]|nr:epoxyqueuosine reductase QueH [Erysipelotrichaceae bacterium]